MSLIQNNGLLTDLQMSPLSKITNASIQQALIAADKDIRDNTLKELLACVGAVTLATTFTLVSIAKTKRLTEATVHATNAKIALNNAKLILTQNKDLITRCIAASRQVAHAFTERAQSYLLMLGEAPAKEKVSMAVVLASIMKDLGEAQIFRRLSYSIQNPVGLDLPEIDRWYHAIGLCNLGLYSRTNMSVEGERSSGPGYITQPGFVFQSPKDNTRWIANTLSYNSSANVAGLLGPNYDTAGVERKIALEDFAAAFLLLRISRKDLKLPMRIFAVGEVYDLLPDYNKEDNSQKDFYFNRRVYSDLRSWYSPSSEGIQAIVGSMALLIRANTLQKTLLKTVSPAFVAAGTSAQTLLATMVRRDNVSIVEEINSLASDVDVFNDISRLPTTTLAADEGIQKLQKAVGNEIGVSVPVVKPNKKKDELGTSNNNNTENVVTEYLKSILQ